VRPYRLPLHLKLCTPTCRTVFHAFSVLLRVLAFHVNGKPDNDRPRNADKQIGGVQARRDTGKGGGKARPKLQELFACVCAGGKAYCCAYLVKQIDKEQIGQVEDKQLFDFLLHSDTSLSLFFTLSRCAFKPAAFSFREESSLRIEGFFSCVSFFAENSLKAAVSTSASRPLKNTR